eukprot:TRINITY_DN12225_c0_g1::TRINITY_DN12225_c0_g1_i1::g.13004::m.13004 TRINITY_DN12225_c0_g1::TRINITY_DN12225_c0_g1_i1::g.13004  ORF type:complete len:392 (+),score=73.87,sp/Q54C25/GPN1_DICDI/61.09/2e-135,ATP_bind_1/PF03029.12/3.1e-85,AAA_10/PF12846.2/5.6e-07,GTP_EFTU/PF00009.22/1.7e-06,AAA_17/PF13207.1/0.00013,AAA_17/PF13207.1/17,AAA_16/PF13191.1/4.6e-05,AAA_16/PF13191.1/1.3e+03,MMR_HSR1/PF01926.18/3.1e-05,AAA_18/PF13238.1/0.0083,AAA_18/PF13238.1/1.5e+03,AAA_18/PF13238.1/40,FeoB_N/PF02421.13/15,FeoB
MASEGVDVPAQASVRPKRPVACIVIGMAGSGKTTLMQRLNAHLHERNVPGYIVNLDPAVPQLPYGANIDIRDTVKYKEVMKHYNLGPNGGIMTSLNLFATRFDQVMEYAERRADTTKYILLDTPGQIEIFTWSASGQIITELLASSFPTVLIYVVDTPRCVSPVTFMSNMLYACSIMYKTRLPFLVVFNKTDVQTHDFAVKWMQDFEEFQQDLQDDASYSQDLARSMSLVLDEFYSTLKSVGVSAMTGEGIDDFFAAVDASVDDYYTYYRAELDRRRHEAEEAEKNRQEEQLAKLRADLKDRGGKDVVLDGSSRIPEDDDDEGMGGRGHGRNDSDSDGSESGSTVDVDREAQELAALTANLRMAQKNKDSNSSV